MSEVIIVGYQDQTTAERAYNQVLRLRPVNDLVGLAAVHVDLDGKRRVDTPGSIVGATVASGAVWGLIAGLIFLNPALRLLIGGEWGAIIGRLGKSGLNQVFRARVQGLLEPGKGLVVIMVRAVTANAIVRDLAGFGGTLLRASLSTADEHDLHRMLGVAPEPAPVS